MKNLKEFINEALSGNDLIKKIELEIKDNFTDDDLKFIKNSIFVGKSAHSIHMDYPIISYIGIYGFKYKSGGELRCGLVLDDNKKINEISNKVKTYLKDIDNVKIRSLKENDYKPAIYISLDCDFTKDIEDNQIEEIIKLIILMCKFIIENKDDLKTFDKLNSESRKDNVKEYKKIKDFMKNFGLHSSIYDYS